MIKAKTQGRAVIEALKKQPLTYRGMLNLGQGNSPWRRCLECLREDEKLIKGKHPSGVTTWAVRTVRLVNTEGK